MSSFLVLGEGDTRNRWRDGQVCPDVGQGTMAPWARRLGRKRKKKGEKSEENGRKEKEGRRKKRDERRQERRRKKRAESGIGVEKTMNAGGVENGNMN
ncbi:hypothetical protein TNCV_1989431 [Trichonephila clavipes]|nr:hypothetical protein TNCV_1989431 [Trichonephila clavipes]